MTREETLDRAKAVVTGERESTYGGPEDSFRLIANLWEPYIMSKCASSGVLVCIEPEDVAILLALLKIARLASSPAHEDSWVDLAGYAACGAEIGTK